MGRLRSALNKGGKDHFIPANRKRPFRPQAVFNERDGRWEARPEFSYPKVEDLNNGPMYATVILMAFERAFECGGYRADCFIQWFKTNIGSMQVELVQTIEGRLFSAMERASGRTMNEQTYFEWQKLLKDLRKYLYGI